MGEKADNLGSGSSETGWVVESGERPATGWSDGEPTEAEAIVALAGRCRGTAQEYVLIMDGLRRSGKEGLAKLEAAEGEEAAVGEGLAEA